MELKKILGKSYYNYTLESSNYTPSLNGSITITCTLKNALGKPVSNRDLQLFKNNTKTQVQTTNSDGIATWTLTMTNSGIQSFRVGNANIEVYVDDIVNKIYPIGSIYMSVDSTSPATLFGGTWEQIKDKFLLSCGDTYNNGSTGGSADAIVVSHTHTFDRAYALTTDSTQGVDRNSNAGQTGTKVNNLLQSNGGAIYRNTINSTGDSGTGKNMPPYLSVYMWKRTA